MSIRTTVTLDDDVLERVKQESRSRGLSFKQTLNEMLRAATLPSLDPPPGRQEFKIKPMNLKFVPGLNYDKIGNLLEYLEGPDNK